MTYRRQANHEPPRKGIGISLARFGEKSAYADLLQELKALQQDLIMLEAESAEILQKVDARHRASATNLVHYLALRRPPAGEARRRWIVFHGGARNRMS